MAFTVFVDGQEGTTGLRIHEVLAGRRDVELHCAGAAAVKAMNMGEKFPDC